MCCAIQASRGAGVWDCAVDCRPAEPGSRVAHRSTTRNCSALDSSAGERRLGILTLGCSRTFRNRAARQEGSREALTRGARQRTSVGRRGRLARRRGGRGCTSHGSRRRSYRRAHCEHAEHDDQTDHDERVRGQAMAPTVVTSWVARRRWARSPRTGTSVHPGPAHRSKRSSPRISFSTRSADRVFESASRSASAARRSHSRSCSNAREGSEDRPRCERWCCAFARCRRAWSRWDRRIASRSAIFDRMRPASLMSDLLSGTDSVTVPME